MNRSGVMGAGRVASGIAAITLCGTALAQQSTDYTAKARLATSAFECEKFSEVARLSEKATDSARLFDLGFTAAKSVFNARRNGAQFPVSSGDMANIMLWIALGPSSDYDTGVMHEMITSMAWNRIVQQMAESGKEPTLTDVAGKKEAAKTLYQRSNCEFLGR